MIPPILFAQDKSMNFDISIISRNILVIDFNLFTLMSDVFIYGMIFSAIFSGLFAVNFVRVPKYIQSYLQD